MQTSLVEDVEAGFAKAHSVVWIAANNIGAGHVALPIIVTRDGEHSAINMDFLLFSRHAAKNGASRGNLARAANVVGLMVDYAHYVARSPIQTEDDVEAFLGRFLRHRFVGTVAPGGLDETGLCWRPVRWQTVREDRRHLLAFIEFCLKDRGHYPSLRAGAVETGNKQVPGNIRFVLDARKAELLAHLGRFRSPRERADRIVVAGIVTPGSDLGRRSSSAGGCLPEEEVRRLISMTRNPVHKAIFILAFYGGPRLSECLQMWVNDVLPINCAGRLFQNARGGAGPLVVLAHPSESTYTGTIGDRRLSRLQKLASDGLLPRSLLPKSNKLWAGWKGMSFDNPNLFISKVFWADPQMAQVFGDCCAEICEARECLPAARRHPWLFVCLDRRHTEAGQPVKVHGARKAFYAACARAGIEPHRNHATFHRARSHYDQLLIDAGFNSAERSELLHHRSLGSEEAYGRNVTRLNEALDAYFVTKHQEAIQ